MKLIRCNRCGDEMEVTQDAGLGGLMKAMTMFGEARRWSRIQLAKPSGQEGVMGDLRVFDLCEDCREIFLLQFMTGAEIAAITKRADQTPLPHNPMTDCQLVFDPSAGRFVCYHDDPERFHKLTTDVLQDVVEGVPAKEIAEIQRDVRQMADDVETAGKAHAIPQRCSKKCSEMHTYEKGCLLRTGRDNLKVYCPECPEGEAPMTRSILPQHMADVHGRVMTLGELGTVPHQRNESTGGVDHE